MENSNQYPYGTTEQYPNMIDSDLNVLDNTAHFYTECSNAGICNRAEGVCECFEGFEGVACQRMSCPGEVRPCNGKGVCQAANQFTQKMENSEYFLWDKEYSRSCVCDAGYFGADCSYRKCPHGIDPLYIDDITSIQYPSFFFAVMTTSTTLDYYDGVDGEGYFNIQLFDHHNESRYSDPIPGGASCDEMIKAIEAIPGPLVPAGLTKCYKSSFVGENPLDSSVNVWQVSYDALYRFYLAGTKTYSIDNRPAFQEAGYLGSYESVVPGDTLLSGDLYYLQFFGNPGYFKQPEINVYLEGSRPSIQSKDGVLITKSWTSGQQGANWDFFPDHCFNVKVRIVNFEGGYYLWGPFIDKDLFKCLGDADFEDPDVENDSNDISETFKYSYGTHYNPHVVRLVRHQIDVRDGSMIALLYYDPDIQFDTHADYSPTAAAPPDPNTVVRGAYRIMHPYHSLDDNVMDEFEVFTSKGTVQQIGNYSEVAFNFGSHEIYVTNVTKNDDPTFNGDIACENLGVDLSTPDNQKECLEKGDYIFLIDPYQVSRNPAFMNMYNILSIQTFSEGQEIRNKRNVITVDYNTNWAQDTSLSGVFHVYKFTPPAAGYQFVSECANRGLCNYFEGVCDCFTGYTGEACDSQNILAV